MTFSKTLYVLTYCICFWSFLILAAFGQLPVVTILAYTAAFLLCLANDRFRFLRIHDRVWLGISVLVLSASLYAWFALNIYFDAVVSLFLYLEINKLWTSKSHRDLLQLYGLTFFKVLAASVSTSSVLFGPMLLVYLFLILAVMITATIKRDAELALLEQRRRKQSPAEAPGTPLPLKGSRRMGRLMTSEWMTTRLFKKLSLALIFVVTVGVGLFFLIPRLQGQALSLGLASPAQARMTSGFSDTINFIGMGEIQTDPTIAARAIPGSNFPMQDGYPTIPLLRLRGTSVDTYDGRTWKKSETVQRHSRTTDRRRMFEYRLEPAYRAPSLIYRMRIQMDPNRRGFVFGPDRTFQYFFDEEQVGLLDEISSSLQLMNPKPNAPINYSVEVRVPSVEWEQALPAPREEALLADALAAVNELFIPFRSYQERGDGGGFGRGGRREFTHESFMDVFTQIPDIPDMVAIREFAHEWTKELPSPIEKAKRLEHRLRNHFGYSLDVSFSTREDHLTYFLTERRAGHCEYFATVMVLSLRAIGIPARVVNGYATDEWVAGGSGYYIVRQEHAHSWVEAWFPNAGWMTFDPTPSAGIGGNRLPNTFYRRMTRWYDMLKFQWYDKIIDYGAQDQTNMMIAIFRGIDRASFIGSYYGGQLLGRTGGAVGAGWLLVLLLVIVAIVAAILSYLLKLRRQRKQQLARLSGDHVPIIPPIEDYRLLLERLEDDHQRPPAATPLEYARTIVVQKSELADLVPLTEHYYGARYNGTAWTEAEARRARALLHLIAPERKSSAGRNP